MSSKSVALGGETLGLDDMLTMANQLIVTVSLLINSNVWRRRENGADSHRVPHELLALLERAIGMRNVVLMWRRHGEPNEIGWWLDEVAQIKRDLDALPSLPRKAAH